MSNKLGKELEECELCGCEESSEIPYIREYTKDVPFHICKGCGFVYYKFRRTPQELAEYWENEMYNKGNYVARNPYFKARHTYAAEFIDMHLDLNGKKVTDIGAGDGQFLEFIKKYGAKGFGIDSSLTNEKIMNENEIENYCGTIEDYANDIIENENFKADSDIATIIWTLQNSQSATDMLNSTYDVLKEDGYVYLQLSIRVLNPFNKPMGLYFAINQPGDVQPYIFSIRSLQGFLAKAGFEIKFTNNYWDQEIINIIAQKVPKTETVSWEKDNFDDVVNYFIRWHNESKQMVDYIKILDLDYKFYDRATFYRDKNLVK